MSCNPCPEQQGRRTYQQHVVHSVLHRNRGDGNSLWEQRWGNNEFFQGKGKEGEGKKRSYKKLWSETNGYIACWNIKRNSWGVKKNGKVTYWVDLQVDVSQFKLFVSPRAMFHLEISWRSPIFWGNFCTTDIESQIILWRTVLCIAGSLQHPWPLLTRSNCFHLPTVTTERVSRYCQISLGMKGSGNHLSWEPVF